MRNARVIEPLDRPMRFTVKATSAGRCWTGIDARICNTSGGFTAMSPASQHSISMHLSTPIRATCRLDARAIPRLQVAGDIDLLPAGTAAAWQDDGETTMIVVHLNQAIVHSAAESMGIDEARIAIPPHLQLRDPQIQHIALALKAELESQDPYGRVYAESLGLALASHLLRKYAMPRTHRPNDVSKRRLQRVMEYVHEHFTRDLSLVELANVADVSPSHLKTVFRQTTGLPVHQYIIRLRVEYAIRLTLESKLPLSEIAIIAGFANQSHMARLTRRIIGTSPGSLRGRESLNRD